MPSDSIGILLESVVFLSRKSSDVSGFVVVLSREVLLRFLSAVSFRFCEVRVSKSLFSIGKGWILHYYGIPLFLRFSGNIN